MKSLAEAIKSFKIPIPPESVIEKTIEDFIYNLRKKKVKIKTSFQGKTIFIKTDVYTKREILLNQKEIVKLIKEKFPKIPTTELK